MHLPSSFEGEYGFIRYIVSVKVEYPADPGQELERRITVIKSHDIDHPDLQVFIGLIVINNRIALLKIICLYKI